MSERMLRVPLAELETVRVVCRLAGCGTVVELPLDRLGGKRRIACPVCSAVLQDANYTVLESLAQAVQDLLKRKDLEVQFVLRQNGGGITP